MIALLFALGNSLTFDQAIDLAQKNSPSVIAAQAEVEAARASQSVARGKRGPQIYALGWGTQSQMGGLVPAAIAGMAPSLISVPNGAFYQGALMLSLPLFTGGALESGALSASYQVSAVSAELDEMRSEAAMKGAEAYLKALSQRSQADAEQARVEAMAQAVANAKAQLEAGKGIAASVARAEAELTEAKRAQTSAQNEAEKAIYEVQTVTGLGFEDRLELASEFGLSDSSRTLTDWIKLAKEKRGSLRAARARVKAVEADVKGAEGDLKPQLYGTAMSELTSRSDMRSNQTVGLTVSVPLVNSSMRADVARMRAMRDRARAMLRETELNVEKEVRQAWLDLTTAAANAESAKASVASAQSAYEVVATRVQVGKAILVEQLDALQALQRAKSDLRMAIFDHEIALVKLARAAGESPDPHPQPPLHRNGEGSPAPPLALRREERSVGDSGASLTFHLGRFPEKSSLGGPSSRPNSVTLGREGRAGTLSHVRDYVATAPLTPPPGAISGEIIPRWTLSPPWGGEGALVRDQEVAR